MKVSSCPSVDFHGAEDGGESGWKPRQKLRGGGNCVDAANCFLNWRRGSSWANRAPHLPRWQLSNVYNPIRGRISNLIKRAVCVQSWDSGSFWSFSGSTVTLWPTMRHSRRVLCSGKCRTSLRSALPTLCCILLSPVSVFSLWIALSILHPSVFLFLSLSLCLSLSLSLLSEDVLLSATCRGSLAEQRNGGLR